MGVPGAGAGAPPIQRRERVLLGYEQVFDFDVVAPRACTAADVPGVDDACLRFRVEVGDPHVLVTIGPPPGRVTVEDLAGTVEQGGVHAATGKEPVPGDPVAARRGDGPATRVRRPGRDADRVAVKELAAYVGLELGALAEAVDPHRQAPTRRAVGPRHFLDHAECRDDVGAEPALRLRHCDLEQSGVADVHDEIMRQLPRGLDLVGPFADARRERAGDLEGRGCCPGGVGDHGFAYDTLASMIQVRRLGQPLLVPQGGRRLPARGRPHPLARLDQGALGGTHMMLRLGVASAGLFVLTSCAMAGEISSDVRSELAPMGKLRVGINHGNFLLVTPGSSRAEPRGVAPDLARELGRRLGVPVELVGFDTAGTMADAVRTGAWDIAVLGAEPQRAREIAFTAAYLEIPATYLVPAGSPIRALAEVDKPGIRIAVSDKSAYELWLSRNIKHATLMRTQGIDASYDLFVNERLEVLSGLRPRLLTDVQRLPGARILDGQFAAVQQAIGTPRAREAGAKFLRGFVEDVKASGLVAQAISRNGVQGVSVAPAAS